MTADSAHAPRSCKNAEPNIADAPLRPQAKAAQWAVRLTYLAVFVVNVQCALSFAVNPDGFAGAYQLENAGVAGLAAVQGIGVAFLMWNCTYPAVIASPARFLPLAAVVLVQQAVGLVGETIILFQLPDGYEVLASSVERFILFDGFGLIIMGLAFAWMLATRRPAKR